MKVDRLIEYLLLSFCIFYCGNVISQNPPNKTLHCSYDDNGNRIHRWITVILVKEDVTHDSINQMSAYNKDNITPIKDQYIVQVNPNPTTGLLTLKIIGLKQGEIGEYIFYS